jgi:hypothetical protein
MDARTVKMMIETRLKAAQQTGNTTEASLMFELLKMSEELKALKNSQEEK